MADDIEKLEHDKLQKDKETPSIGGTAAAVITMEAAGLTPPFGKSAFDIWGKLTGLLKEEKPDAEKEDRFEMGRLLEEPIAIRFQRRTGLTVEKVPLIVHPEYPWYTGHIDRIVKEKPADLEIKTVGFYQDRDVEWSDPAKGEEPRVPIAYLFQAIWYCGLPRAGVGAMERESVFFAAQFDFRSPLRIYEFPVDDAMRETHARMFEACQRFWEEHVVKKMPPPVDPARSLASAQAAVKLRFPSPTLGIVETDNRYFVDLARAYEEACALEKKAKGDKERLGVEIQNIIGKHYGVTAAVGGVRAKATWPLVKLGARTLKPTEFRRLNVSINEE